MLQDLAGTTRSLATDTGVLGLTTLLLVSAVLSWWLPRSGRTDQSSMLLFAAFGSLAVIVASTLFRDRPAFVPGEILSWSTTGWQRISYDPVAESESILNLALFVPAGIAWTLLLGRPVRVLAGLAGLSVLIECVQAVTASGANDIADLIANTAGAGLGVLGGTALLWSAPPLGRGRRPTRRRFAVAAGTLLVVVAVSIAGLQVGAGHRQTTLERELTSRFAATTLAHYRSWEAEDRLHDEVFDVASAFADGAQHLDCAVRVRYPASFFGLRRCVFVEWYPDGARIRGGSGAECAGVIG